MTKKVLVHILLWLIFFGIIAYGFTINLNTTVSTPKGDTRQTDFTLLPFRLEIYGIVFKILFFYTCIFLLFPKLFRNKSPWLFSPFIVLTAVLCFLLETFLLKTLVIGDMISTSEFSFKAYTYYLYRVNPLMYFILLILAFVHFFVDERSKNEKLNSIAKQERLKAELAVLRYQINPHFLFNTLNNFFAIAQEYKVAPLENGILKLSKMMRYILYESNLELMPLAKELEYLENYMSIYQYKFDSKDTFEMKFSVTGKPDRKRIAPLLFIPLVENALKHGFRFNKPSFVDISIDVQPAQLEFIVVNSLHESKTHLKDTYGIGLSNIQKRLELIYPGQHTFEISEHQDTFKVHLKVPLHDY